jgi:GST-like protein
MAHQHPIFARWPAKHLDRLQLYSLPTRNGLKVSIMLEETGLAYEVHRIDIMANENHDPAFLSLNPNGKHRRYFTARMGTQPDRLLRGL